MFSSHGSAVLPGGRSLKPGLRTAGQANFQPNWQVHGKDAFGHLKRCSKHAALQGSCRCAHRPVRTQVYVPCLHQLGTKAPSSLCMACMVLSAAMQSLLTTLGDACSSSVTVGSQSTAGVGIARHRRSPVAVALSTRAKEVYWARLTGIAIVVPCSRWTRCRRQAN